MPKVKITNEENVLITTINLDYDVERGGFTFNDWFIEQVGGHITIKRWEAVKEKSFIWGTTRQQCLRHIWQLENGQQVKPIYLRALY